MKPAIALAAMVLLVGAVPPTDHSKLYLLSLKNLPIGRQAPRLEAFEIETYGVFVRAVCRIPEDWQIVAGAKFGIFGDFNGAAAHGAGWLNRSELAEDGPLLLVEMSSPVQKNEIAFSNGAIPPTFKGKAIIEDIVHSNDKTVPIGASNIRLVPAHGCPPRTAGRTHH